MFDIGRFIEGFSDVSLGEALIFLKPLFIFIIGMGIYALFVFKFYRFIARKRIFELNLAQYNTSKHPLINKFFAVIFYFLENIILLPLFTFFWFMVFAVMLVFVSKNSSIENVLLISGALIGTIRLTAYYSEDLSKDVAKMVPFAILGFFIIDISYFSISDSLTLMQDFVYHGKTILYYLVFIILLEFGLNIVYGVFSFVFGSYEEKAKARKIEKE